MANDVIAPNTDPPHPLDVIVATEVPKTALAVPGILNARVNELYARMEQHPGVTDQSSIDTMRAIVRDASELKRDIEQCRKRVKEPFLRAGQAIDAEANRFQTRLDIVIDEGKRQQADFAIERDRKIAEQRKLLEEAEKAAQTDTSRPTPPLTVLVPTEEINIPISRRKVVVITDRMQIPSEYWIIDEKRLEADVLAGKVVPGTRIDIQQNVVAR
jgi:hypothetical protein